MTILAKFPGRCTACGKPIVAGEEIEWSRGSGSRHAACASAAPAPAARECVVERRGSAWTFRGPIETKDVPKTAVWRWHPGEDCSTGRSACTACALGVPRKIWWTDSAEKLGDLVRRYDAASGDKPPLRFSDAETERLARGTAETQTEAIEASRATDAGVDVPAPAGLAYLGYQRAGIAFAAGRPATLIADEMGLGKTIEAIGVINADPTIEKVLVLCPASLRGNWRRELEKWLVRPRKIDLPSNGHAPDGEAEVAIVNYDKLVGARGADLHAALMGREWDLIVADEAHYLKNPKSQRTLAVIGRPASYDGKRPAVAGLASRARRRLFLTGTPILNCPIEAYPLLAALSPAEFGDFWRFARRYCDAQRGAYGWDFSGASHLDELQERLRKTVMVRRLKADVLKDLPPKRRQVVVLDAGEDAAARRALQAESAAYAGQDDDAEMARAIGGADYEEQVAALWASARDGEDGEPVDDAEREDMRRRGGKDKAGIGFTALARARHALALAKVPYAIEHVAAALEDGAGKVLVWCHHRAVAAALADHFGPAAVSITGATPPADRQSICDKFQSDASVRVFVGNIKAAGVGLTLTAASLEVFVELSWVPAENSQAEDRAHRIGQLNPVLIQHLVFDESLDAQVAKVCIEKQDLADKALDDPRAAIVLATPVAPARAPRASGAQLASAREYPAVSDAQRELAHRAVRVLAGMCDGALELDGMGFNKMDARFGHRLAECEVLTDGQAWAATRLARKYRRQLDASLVAALGVGEKSKEKGADGAK